MVQTVDLRNSHDAAGVSSWYRPCIRSVLIQPEMRPGFMIVGQEQSDPPIERSLAEDDHMIEAFPANRPHEPLYVGSLPRRPGRGKHFLNPQGLDWLREVAAKNLIAVAQEILGALGRRETLPAVAVSPSPPSDER